MSDNKLLRGTTREAIVFIKSNFWALLKLSAIPYAIYILCSVIQVKILQDVLHAAVAALSAEPAAAVRVQTPAAVSALSWIAFVLAPASLVLAFVQITRFRGKGEQQALAHAAGLKAFAMTMVYAAGMFILAAGAYVLAVVALTPLRILFGAALSPLPSLAAILFAFWILCRLFVALPGIALGHRPDFLRDIWQLAKGESMAVPLRLLACFIIYNGIVVAAILPALQRVSAAMPQAAQSATEADFVRLLSAVVDQAMQPLILVWTSTLPVAWLASLILAIAFDRFLARQKAPQAK